MIRHFCDFCGEEMQPLTGGQNHARLETTLTRLNKSLTVEVLHSMDGVSNAGEACKYCILEALQTLDDRPKQQAS